MPLKRKLFFFDLKYDIIEKVNKMKNEVKDSNVLLYKRYRLLEFISFIIIIVGGIIASLSSIYRFRGEKLYYIYLTLVLLGAILVIIGLVLFLIFYFKIKRLKESK